VEAALEMKLLGRSHGLTAQGKLPSISLRTYIAAKKFGQSNSLTALSIFACVCITSSLAQEHPNVVCKSQFSMDSDHTCGACGWPAWKQERTQYDSHIKLWSAEDDRAVWNLGTSLHSERARAKGP
jgi:hypothetical protein